MTEPSRPSETTWRLPARLDGRGLVLARVAWVCIAVVVSGLAAVGFARAFDDPLLVAMPPLTDLFVRLGLDFRVMILVALLTPFVTAVLVSGAVFWRRSRDPMALIFSMGILLLHTYASRSLITYQDGFLQHAPAVVFSLFVVCVAVILGLFPDGQFVPKAAACLAPVAVAFVVAFPDGSPMLLGVLDGDVTVTGRVRGYVVGFVALLGLGVAAQLHRYRHVSGPVARQQAKWVVAPLGALLLLFTVALGLLVGFPGSADDVAGWVLLAVIPMGVVLPIMIANAVLRYRLYEIDRVISRTITYGFVISLLAGVYVVGVVGLGTAVSAVTGQRNSDLAVAVSVLAVLGLFRPLRGRVRLAVDRRFNRTGFEGRTVVEELAGRLHDQVRLEDIPRELSSTAAGVFQPQHISVWIAARPSPERRDERQIG